jgi:histidine triad (HIT) family protein
MQKIEIVSNQLKKSDIVHQNQVTTAFMATRRLPKNQGHVLVIPNQHFENIYDLPDEIGAQIYSLARTVALAMKATYQCDGILIRQHNEPAGGQHIWHYHLHIIPRYEDDDFYNSLKEPFHARERAKYAQMLRNWIAHKA